MDLKTVYSQLSPDVEATEEWCNELYISNFSKYFEESRNLFKKLQSKSHPITDEELSYILINLPLTLFDVSEVLNSFRVKFEVVKLKNKETEAELMKSCTAKTVAQKKDEVSVAMTEEKLICTVLSYIITRVESEISFCRELIMGAKKIWDSRKRGDLSNPVGNVDTETILPDYQPKEYIKGC